MVTYLSVITHPKPNRSQSLNTDTSLWLLYKTFEMATISACCVAYRINPLL